MFWNNKNKKDQKNQENLENLEYFLKIALTKDQKLNIYIGWPASDEDAVVFAQLQILLSGIMNGLFNKTIEETLISFNNSILTKALENLPKIHKNHISPMDVL